MNNDKNVIVNNKIMRNLYKIKKVARFYNHFLKIFLFYILALS